MALHDMQFDKFGNIDPLVEYAGLVNKTRELKTVPITNEISDRIAKMYMARAIDIQSRSLEGAVFENHRLSPLYMINKALEFAKGKDLRDDLLRIQKRMQSLAETKHKFIDLRNGRVQVMVR